MLTQLEEMALAVLKGDLNAAYQLMDVLMEERMDGATRIIPVKKLSVPVDRIRVVAYIKALPDEEVVIDPQIMGDINAWIRGGPPILMIDSRIRLEVYELPESFFPKPSSDSEPLRNQIVIDPRRSV